MRLTHVGHLNGGVLSAMSLEQSWENRPVGSPLLWCSPEASNNGWLESDNFRIEEHQRGLVNPNLVWTIELHADARLAKVETQRDYQRLLRIYPDPRSPGDLDWSSLVVNHDAFWLTERGHHLNGQAFRMWDVETVVVFNHLAVRLVESRILDREG